MRLASAFLHVPFEDFDKGLDDALHELATLESVTRVSVWQADGDRVVLRGAWAAPVDVPSVPLSPRIRVRDFELMRLVARGEEVHLTEPWHHGPEFEAERVLFERAGTQSLLAAPLWSGDEFAGMVMLESTLPGGHFGVGHAITLRSAAAILAEAFARHEAECRLAEQARTDRVTGLGNRWAFDEALDRALNAVASGTSPGFGMAIIDLDRFKLVNDSLGHAVGDRLLADVAARLSGAAGPSTVLARLGGDELLVLLDESPSPAATLEAVEAMVAPLAVPFDVGGETMVVTASVGVLHQADGRSSPGDLLRWVDLAMYRAKAFGGDTIEMDDPKATGQASRRGCGGSPSCARRCTTRSCWSTTRASGTSRAVSSSAPRRSPAGTTPPRGCSWPVSSSPSPRPPASSTSSVAGCCARPVGPRRRGPRSSVPATSCCA